MKNLKIGIIGTGEIGSTLTRHFTRLGHDVVVANSRGPETLADLAKATGAKPVQVAEVPRGRDLVVVTFPEGKVPQLPRDLFKNASPNLIVIDTGNYYPRQRDGKIEGIENGLLESRWVEQQIQHPVIKVFNNINFEHLANRGKPPGTPGRIALPVSGDDAKAKQVVMELVNDMGFDSVDTGGLDESWRQQPGTPVYDGDFDAAGVRRALAQAKPERKPEWRATAGNSTNKTHMTNNKIKIVVIGGTGLIGKKLVNNLRQRGHEVVAASPSSGVNTVTGEGLANALSGAQVVVDVANAPSWEDKAVLDFFETSGRNLLAAEKVAGVKYHVALSVVGTDRLLASGYFRAKMAQETLIKASKIPYTIVRATQFFEFVGSMAQNAAEGATVRLPSAIMQPIVSDDVAAALADVATGEPLNGMVEIAGPEQIRQDELVRQYLKATGDARQVVTDEHARYYGLEVNDQSLVPDRNARLGPTRFADWLSRNTPQKKPVEREPAPASKLAGVAKVVALLLCGIGLAALTLRGATAQDSSAGDPKEAKVTPLMSKDLPEFPGKEGLMLMIEYPPGSVDPVHRHNAHGFIYVLEGSIVMQVRGGKEVTLTPGQTFYEGPQDIHVVGRNASQTKPAKFVVVFLKDKGAPVLVPAK